MEQIEKYIESSIEAEDAVLSELTRQTHLRTTRPRMISGHIQGELLKILTLMVSPKRVLELGTFTGYSAICIARGLSDEAVLHTVDNNDELEGLAREFFDKAGVGHKIVQHIGDCMEVIKMFDEPFDLVFLDADKRQYCDYYNALFDKGLVHSRSVILADNVLWSGKILDEVASTDKHSLAILKFNEMVKNDSRIEKIILPLRDGVSLIYVK